MAGTTNTQQTQAGGGGSAADPNGLVARLGGKVRKWKDAANVAVKERDDLAARLAAAETKLKEIEARPPDQAAAERDLLRAELRDIKHREVFNRAAEDAGAVTDAQKADLWKLSGYKAETDTPDPKAIGDVIAAQKAERSYLFGQPAGDGTVPPVKPAAGSGKGSASSNGQLQVTRANLNDPYWNQANQAALASGNFVILD
jgi:hypothetical protein